MNLPRLREKKKTVGGGEDLICPFENIISHGGFEKSRPPFFFPS